MRRAVEKGAISSRRNLFDQDRKLENIQVCQREKEKIKLYLRCGEGENEETGTSSEINAF